MIRLPNHNVIWSFHHITPGNHKITPSSESPRTPSVASSHSRPTASHLKTNIRLRVPNRHIKSTRKVVIPRRKQALVKDNRKSFGGKLRMLSSYTLPKDSSKTLLEKLCFCDVVEIPKKWNFGALEFPPSEPAR